MITYLVGNPGSGKTYYAVFKIWQQFIFIPKDNKLLKFIKRPSKPSSSDLLYCYTNINQFKFDLDPRLFKFEFEKFYSDIELLYFLYLDKATDDEINEKAKELNLHKVLFVIDECHNFLKSKDDPVLVWWLTYHRHLYQEIILITQDLTLVNNEYKRVAEQFLKAVDSSKRLFKNRFKYVLYGSYKMYQKDIMNKISVPYLQEVFELYHSGNQSSNKSFVRKFLFIALVIFIALLIYFYFFLKTFQTDQPQTHESTITPTTPAKFNLSATKQTVNPSTIDTLSEIYFYNLSCIKNNCRIDQETIIFPKSYLLFAIGSNKPVYFYSQTKMKELDFFFVVFDKPVLDKFKKGVSYEKDNLNSVPSINVFGSSPSSTNKN